jgi:hypothetical protein
VGIEILSAYVVSDFNGDARYGIMGLRQLGEWNKWDEKSAKDAVNKGIADLEYFFISSLSDDRLYLLYLVSSHPDGTDTASLCREFVKKFDISKPTYFEYVKALDREGMIYMSAEKKKGKPQFVYSTLHFPELVETEIKRRRLYDLLPPEKVKKFQGALPVEE